MPARSLSLLLSLALASAPPFVVASPRSAQGPAVAPRDAGLLEGMRLVDEGDLSAAVISLDPVIRRLSAAAPTGAELALAHLYMGMAQLGLEQSERALGSMREAHRADPSLRLDPRRYSPRVLQAFAQANPDLDRATPSPSPQPSATPSPSPSAGGAKTSAKKGSSKTLLVAGGVALVGGGAAVAASQGGTSSPPASTTSKSPQLVLAQSSQIPAPVNGVVNFHFWNFSIPGPGVVQYTANWTSPSAEFRLYIAGTPCSDASPLATTTVTSKPATLNYAAGAGGNYCVGIVYQKGDGPESYSLQVVYTPQ